MIGIRRNSLNDHVQVTHGTPYRYAKFFPDPEAAGNGIVLCRHDVRFRCLGPEVRDALEVVGPDLGAHLRSRRVEGLEVHAVSSRHLAAAIRARIDSAPYDFQAAPRRTTEIDRIHAMHRRLATEGTKHFALDRDGAERWLYVIPRRRAPARLAAAAGGEGDCVLARFPGAEATGDDQTVLDLAADNEAPALWRNVQARLQPLAACPATRSLGDAARLALWTWH